MSRLKKQAYESDLKKFMSSNLSEVGNKMYDIARDLIAATNWIKYGSGTEEEKKIFEDTMVKYFGDVDVNDVARTLLAASSEIMNITKE